MPSITRDLLGREVKPLKIVYRKAMHNWISIADLIYTEELKSAEILSVIGYELDTRRRTYILDRLYARYCKVYNKEQKKLFNKEVAKWIPKKTRKST